MKLATTTGDFAKHFSTYREKAEAVCHAGFRYLDLDMYTIAENDPLLVADDWEEICRQLKDCADSFGATFVQAHSPGGNPLQKDSQYESLLNATLRSIAVCGKLGIPNIVVHAGMLPGIGKEEYFEKNKTFYEKLFPAMEKYQVNVLCENSTKANMGNMYYLFTGKDMLEFVQYVDHPLFHACWDTGHGNCEGKQYQEITALGKELYALHINDNRGQHDEHLMPFFGTMDADEIMRALMDIDYRGYFTFEAGSVLHPSHFMPGGFAANTGSPLLFMQEHLEKLLYDTGVFLLKRYRCFEE